MAHMIPPASSGSTLGSPSSWLSLENLHREGPRRHSYQMPSPPQLAPFDTAGLKFEMYEAISNEINKKVASACVAHLPTRLLLQPELLFNFI